MPALTASNATLAGSAPSRSDRTTCAPTRSPQVCSWSAAAARNVSAAPSTTVLPSPTSTRASLPQVVVLPVPLTPTTSTTDGRSPCLARCSVRSMSGPIMADQVGAQQRADRGRVVRARDLDLGAQLLDQLAGRADAHVGGDEGVFDLLPGLLVELAGGKQVQQYGPEALSATWPAGRAAGPGGRPTAAASR